MKLSNNRKSTLLLFCLSMALVLLFSVNQLAQTQTPAPKGHVNDFAGVVDEKTKQQLENVLANVKLKTGIEFDIATVQTTAGQDIFDFSRQLATDWNVGARTSVRKSLLLVVSVTEKASFTQFSKSVQNSLPDGVLGEMSQRMRAPVEAGQFSAALNAGVNHFVSSLAQKLALSTDDFDKTSPIAPTASQPTSARDSGRPDPALTQATIDTLPVSVKPPESRSEKVPAKTKRTSSNAVDEGDSETVELTLTKPLAERTALLKAFLDSHPDSKSRARAMELLVSSRAALGDERLKKGDTAGGIEQLTLAIADTPLNPSERLFAGVISQIPLNLYLRGETAAAAKAARDIETKFGNDPKRLLALSGFYVSTEQGAEAVRLAQRAVQLAPDLAESHQGVARALHVSLRLDEAAAEYKRALELDPNSKAARRGLADLKRAFGKAEEALALYRQQLEAEPADKAARTGLVLSLLDLSRADEAKVELEKALQTDPQNATLLAGAAYWFAAHNDGDLALALARRAVGVEPRYTWSQIALARALVAQQKPLEAERALRFAREYGKFPTLDYELASTLAATGLYDEAAEVLMQSFNLRDGQIETRLGGQVSARGAGFIELLAPERRASIFQSVAADTENNAKVLKALLVFAAAINPENGAPIHEASATAAAKEFASGEDAARVHRQLYAAARLLQRGVGFQTAYELAEAARSSAEAGMSVPALTLAVQADEYRGIRARAIAAGGTPDIPDAPRNVLSNLLRGRIEDTAGWARFNQDKLDEAADHLKRAVTILPEGTPAARTSLWHLAATLDRQDKKTEALSYYIKSYNAGEPDAVRRTVIEQLYRKVNGTLDGLDERIGPAPGAPVSAQTPAVNNIEDKANEQTAQPTQSSSPTTALPSPGSITPPPTPAPEPGVAPTTEAPAVALPSPRVETNTAPTETTAKPRPTVTITGHVKDATDNPLANVVVVFISPQGTVLTATTDDEGNYSFTVAPSSATGSYRIIPSKGGLTFDPVDRVLPTVSEDVKELNFVGTPVKQSVRLR